MGGQGAHNFRGMLENSNLPTSGKGHYIPGVGHTLGWGTSAPTNGTSGTLLAPGAMYIDVGANGQQYRNTNTLLSPTWKLMIAAGDDATIATATVATIAHAITDLAEHGAGAVGTGVAPNTNRYTRDGVIITDIKIDIAGLKCKGDAQGDCIALTGAGYIGRYVVATCGVCYRIEMICLETPAEGTATFEQDIDLMAEDDDDVAYDGPVDDTVIAAGIDWVAGNMVVDNLPALTPNDYLYLGEGDTGAATGIYSAGQFLIRLYGHPVLT